MPKTPRKKRTHTRTSWAPAQPLPRQIRFIAGESTGSFARRLAAENGLQPEEFWPMVGNGGQIFDPRYSEVYLNAAALSRLARLAGHDAATLQWLLPNLRPHHLMDTGPSPEWRWPWDAASGYLVRACELCARAKGTDENAYLISPTTWQVCTRHQRWLDNRREEHTGSIPLHHLPDIIQAHHRRLTLERRLGESGRALFADAYAIAAYWWNLPVLPARVARAPKPPPTRQNRRRPLRPARPLPRSRTHGRSHGRPRTPTPARHPHYQPGTFMAPPRRRPPRRLADASRPRDPARPPVGRTPPEPGPRTPAEPRPHAAATAASPSPTRTPPRPPTPHCPNCPASPGRSANSSART
ncbi:hypothetical protein G3260_006752 [Streptomyces albus]|nr:hypothetical protein G3260_006752 [Streptomyces albus]